MSPTLSSLVNQVSHLAKNITDRNSDGTLLNVTFLSNTEEVYKQTHRESNLE